MGPRFGLLIGCWLGAFARHWLVDGGTDGWSVVVVPARTTLNLPSLALKVSDSRRPGPDWRAGFWGPPFLAV